MSENPDHKRTYRVGSRRTDLGRNNRDGLMSESRWAWVRIVNGQFVILVDEDDVGRTVRIYSPPAGGKGRPFDLNLSALTKEELDCLRELFMSAFDWADPEVQRRDKEAADAFAQGDDSHARVYRQAPHLVYRKRPVGEYSKGVPERSPGIPQVSPVRPDVPQRPADGELRGHGDVLDEPDAPTGGPEDNGPQVDLAPEL